MRTTSSIRSLAGRFAGIKTVEQLANLLEVPLFGLEFLLKNIEYEEFYIPKKSGGKRQIEDPEDFLKEIQRKLNDYFQAVYYLVRPEPAYGFQWRTQEEANPRNILTNARNHLSKPWMLNADFKDFFHQVSKEKLYKILSSRPFVFSPEIIETLCVLCTYRERLPMGAPTSPVLSNLACLYLDKDLLEYARREKQVYSRYADDLTFSSHQEINESHFDEIRQLSEMNGFIFNPDKVWFYGPDHEKTVTGLVVKDEIDLSKDYLDNLRIEIQKYAHAREVQYRAGKGYDAYFKKFEQQLEGTIEFVSSVLGENHPVHQEIVHSYLKAQNVANHFDPISWLDFGYFDLK